MSKYPCLSLLVVILFAACSCGSGNSTGKFIVDNLQTEYSENPLGIDVEKPRFFWNMSGCRQGAGQKAYEIFVARSEKDLRKGNFIWDSGKIYSDASAGIEYGGPALKPMTEYFWKARVWDNDDVSADSQVLATFETGLMNPSLEAWEGAKWITAPDPVAPEGASTKYSVESDFKIHVMEKSDDHGDYSAGLAFGYSEEDEASYSVQIRMEQETKKVTMFWDRYHRFGSSSGGGTVDLTEKLNADSLLAKPFHFKIEIDGTSLKSYIDGKEVWSTQIDRPRDINCPTGYYNGRTDKILYADNFCMKDGDGNIIYSEDFSDHLHTAFGEQYIDVRQVDGDNMAMINGMMLLIYNKYASRAEPDPLFRKKFELRRGIAAARLYATAAGFYEFYINGKRAHDTYMNPGNFNPNYRFQYQTMDVTEYVHEGGNAIGAILGHGWYDRAGAASGTGAPYGDYNALLGKLVVTYRDGSRDVFVTDGTWSLYLDGPVRNDDLWQGEWYDARKEIAGWTEYDFDDGGWGKAEECKPYGKGADAPITAQIDPPVRNIMILKPEKVNDLGGGRFVYDFGQEFTGICRVTMKGDSGAVITMKHGEWLNADDMHFTDGPSGTVWTRNLLGAEAADRYILKGCGEEVFEPSFTYHSFRYMDMTVDGNVQVVSVEGLVLSSDNKFTGTFECSNQDVNRLYSNAKWSQIDNFISVPVDCPQRTERFGWTGDAQIYSSTAAYISNVMNFYTGYIQDVLDSQNEDGIVCDMSPFPGWCGNGNNGWGDVIVMIPWNMYMQYGSTDLIRNAYDGMCRWVDWLVAGSEDWIRPDSGYGDHLAMDDYARTIINTAWSARVSDLLSRMAEIMGKTDDARKFHEYFENFRKAWVDKWVIDGGDTRYHSQSPIVLGLAFNLYPEEMRASAAKILAEKIEKEGVLTGFAGISYVLPVLCEMGYSDLAYKMLENTSYPSWLYCVKKGATTMWESFRGYHVNDDGTFDIWGSLNHYSYGSVARWLYAYAAGIQYDEAQPGFKHFYLRPCLSKTMSHLSCSYESLYGKIVSGWSFSDGQAVYKAVVPCNTTATLVLPGSGWKAPEGASLQEEGNGSATFLLEAGEYEFIKEE